MRPPLAHVAMLAMASSAASRPAASTERRDSATRCSKTSFAEFKWTVEDFSFRASYIFTTPAHQNSWGYVDFNLSNAAAPDLAVSCNAQSDQLADFFYGSVKYSCSVAGQPGEPAPAPATFSFDRPTGQLSLHQSWVCDDADPQYPTTFSASGNVNLTLECSKTLYENGNWTLGQTFSDREIQCAPVTRQVQPLRISAVA